MSDTKFPDEKQDHADAILRAFGRATKVPAGDVGTCERDKPRPIADIWFAMLRAEKAMRARGGGR